VTASSADGLHYNYFRDYDPVVGRYVERDPAGRWGDPNQYSYAYADPIQRVDALGLWCGSKLTEWIPDAYRGASFADCCRRHDGCYDGCPPMPSLPRASCDIDFRSCVKEKCRGMGSLLEVAVCEMVAETYATAVSTFGQDFYDDARAQSSKNFASHLVTSPSLLGRIRPR
jgi:RHS repeat-associated protein